MNQVLKYTPALPSGESSVATALEWKSGQMPSMQYAETGGGGAGGGADGDAGADGRSGGGAGADGGAGGAGHGHDTHRLGGSKTVPPTCVYEQLHAPVQLFALISGRWRQ